MRKRENHEKKEMKKMEPTYEEIGEESELELLGEKVPEQKVEKMAPNQPIRRILRMNEQKMSKQKVLNKDVEMKDQEIKEDVQSASRLVQGDPRPALIDPKLMHGDQKKSKIPTRNNRGLGANKSKEAQANGSSV